MKPKTSFQFQRKINFYETDMMGVVHHANYLLFFEEARVAWLEKAGFMKFHAPEGPLVFAVLETQVKHLLPAFFKDTLEVHLQAKMERAKIRFRYLAFTQRQVEPIAEGMTLLISLDKKMKVCKPPEEMVQQLKGTLWTETWP